MALIHCPECSREISDTVKKCPHCGYKLKKVKQPKERKPIPKWMFIAGIVCIGLVVAARILIYSMQLSYEELTQVNSLNAKIGEQIAYDLNIDSVLELSEYIKECDSISSEYDELNWKQRFSVTDYEKISGKKEEAGKRIEEIENTEVDSVIKQIDEIGDVSLDSKKKILDAEDGYSALSDDLKKRVANYEQLETAKEKYYELAVNDTVSKISHIGKVSLTNDSHAKMVSAKTAYNDLPADYRSKVSNYSTLVAKEKKYDELNDRKRKLQDVKSELKKGNLNEAKRLLEQLPNGFLYQGTKVSDLKKRLRKNSNWVALCGRWKTTGGRMEVDQVWKYDGSSKGWNRKFSKGEEFIDVHCQLKDNGKVKVKIIGSIPIYTSYSVIAEGLGQGTVVVSKTKTVSSMGTIRIDSNTTLTLSPTGISVNYYKVNPNEDQYFTYKYKSVMDLKKKTVSF
ncbi:MAG: zinc-ribbon domain-containing protein [Lachnospiraceae bacterium]|nr:zinc-ribbon domain-containing protein [Lachnospiraceae bacterium]